MFYSFFFLTDLMLDYLFILDVNFNLGFSFDSFQLVYPFF